MGSGGSQREQSIKQRAMHADRRFAQDTFRLLDLGPYHRREESLTKLPIARASLAKKRARVHRACLCPYGEGEG